MQQDYYKTLKQRTVTQVPDGGGSFTETTIDTDFEGFIAELSGSEVLKNQTLGISATAKLLTDTDLSKTNRVVDVTGYFSEAGTVWEIVYKYVNSFESPYYALKRV